MDKGGEAGWQMSAPGSKLSKGGGRLTPFHPASTGEVVRLGWVLVASASWENRLGPPPAPGLRLPLHVLRTLELRAPMECVLVRDSGPPPSGDHRPAISVFIAVKLEKKQFFLVWLKGHEDRWILASTTNLASWTSTCHLWALRLCVG